MEWYGLYQVSEAHRRCNEITSIVLDALPTNHRDRVKMTYMELLANALQASALHGGQEIEMVWTLEVHRLSLRLTNQGVEFTPTSHQFVMPDICAERGRGLPMAIRFSNALHYHHEDGNTIVTAHWNIPEYRRSSPFSRNRRRVSWGFGGDVA